MHYGRSSAREPQKHWNFRGCAIGTGVHLFQRTSHMGVWLPRKSSPIRTIRAIWKLAVSSGKDAVELLSVPTARHCRDSVHEGTPGLSHRHQTCFPYPYTGLQLWAQARALSIATHPEEA